MKKLMILAVLSLFSLSAAAASACDGMKGHEKSGDATQAKNEKAAKKDKAGETKSDTNKS
jgi:opacity protein-like surface antigen